MSPHTQFLASAAAVLGLVLGRPGPLPAETFRHITAEPTARATIIDAGDLREGGVSYRAIYKPTPRAEWCKLPWICSSEAFRGKNSIGMELQPQPMTDRTDVDKLNLTVSTGRDPFALAFGVPRYTGFAVKLPSAAFEIPEEGRGLLIAQWWQGAPYGPPLRLAVTSDTTQVVSYRFHVKNDDTLGNPSAKDLEIGGGTIPFDTWTTFVVLAVPDHTGRKGEVRVWVNGEERVAWSGRLGYDPSGKPYKGATSETPHPNRKFDVFFGPYRVRQNRGHRMFFDEVKFADRYRDAVP
jgi:hypothetical protein